MNKLKPDQIILIHYVHVSNLSKERTVNEEMNNYKTLVGHQIQFDNIVNVYVPTIDGTHIERLIN